jgi:nucleotide-binding universal stress UspA family protein
LPSGLQTAGEVLVKFQKILLPVDLSAKHGPALEVAAQLAGRDGGEVILLHVIEVIPGLEVSEEKHFYGRLEKLAAAHLEKLGEILKAKHVRQRPEILLGNRGAETVRYAREKGIDLIVVTSPPVDPKNLATSWGSLSYKIGLAANCPVLLVK